MENCLFCKIIAGDIPAEIVFENENLLAFRDISPQAPTHILLIPKIHISTLNDLEPTNSTTVGEMVRTASELAKKEGFSDAGYRTVFNCNADGGQTVYHIHLHLLGGRPFNWPPG